MFKNKYIKIIIYTLIVWALFFGFYVATSNGLGNKPYYLQMRRFVPMSLVCVLTTYFVAQKVNKGFFLSFSIVGAAWLLTYPILHKLTFAKTVPFFSNHFDIVFAAYSFVGFIALGYLALKFGLKKFILIPLSLVQTALMILPLLQIAYYFYYGNCITEMAVLSAYQTNPSEAKEYVLQTLGYSGIFFELAIIILMFLGFYKLNKKYLALTSCQEFNKKTLAYLVLAGFAGTFYAFDSAFPEAGLLLLNSNVREYFHSINEFNAEHKNTLADLQVTPNKPAFDKPSTIIVVIGECASRNFMSAYTKVPADTTPWLREKKNDPNFIVFENPYAVITNTVMALERGLTEKNQYNDKDFKKSATIVDIAKGAGYFTSWYSNQGTTDNSDTPIAIIGKTADVSKWTNQDLNTLQYDGTLLEYLKEVDPNKNNFIVLHFMGSHDNYQNRYPPEFAKWGNPKINEPPLNYDNSLYYSDYVLSKIYEYGKKNLNMQAMLYFSDHGTVPNGRRNADMNPFAALRIPMFLYLSEDYQKTYAHTAQVLKDHKATYYTNDLTYELVCGLLNIKSNRYDETQSLASDKYKYTRETLRTSLGKKKLTEDKE